jgi:hypothetical protein
MRRFRIRRGKLVEIPEEWVGQTAHPQTIRKRDSKLTRKMRNATKNGGMVRERQEKLAPKADEWD